MNKSKFAATLLALVACLPAIAGGIITNTNQSINFLRNPARDAAIGIDGVYSNPAGVAFLPQGFHLSLNWQYAKQTRDVVADNPLFALGAKNGRNRRSLGWRVVATQLTAGSAGRFGTCCHRV